MSQFKLFLALSFLTAGILAAGCSSKKIETTEVPKAVPTTVPVKSAADHYMVVSRDTLWGIAGKSSIYSDNFQWPLIFKANRDTIQDPDLIYPKQDFVIQKGLTDDEISHAKKMAMKTPKYVPHSKPRETLPLDYF
jgi:hypothetical protein